MVYKKFVYHSDLTPEQASQALERELGRIPIAEEQHVTGRDVFVNGKNYLLGTPVIFAGDPIIKARFEIGAQGTELRGHFRHLEPVYFLVLVVVLGVVPFFSSAKGVDWGFTIGAVIGAAMLAIEAREGRGMLNAFRLVAEEALGDDMRNH